MPEGKSRVERRNQRSDVSFPLRLPGGDVIPFDRRVNSRAERNEYISGLKLFQDLPINRIEPVLKRCPVYNLAPGDVLLEPNQANHNLYLLLSGRLSVDLGLAGAPSGFIIDPGESIGEMSIIDGKPTSASITAMQPSRVLAIHENVFWSRIAPIPGASRNLMCMLAERMRSANDFALKALEQDLHYALIQRELNAAREIQAGMLPSREKLFPQFPSVDVFAHMETAREVGGDLFDAFALDDHRICVVIGDVSGKGIPAALFMVRTLTLLRVELMKGGTLAECMARFNDILCESSTAHMFVSLILMLLDVTTGKVELVNAGHNPPVGAIHGEAFRTLGLKTGLIAGVLQNSTYESNALTLDDGDLLLLYTDGLTEARNEATSFYGMDRLAGLLTDLGRRGAEATVSAVREDLKAFIGKAPQADDITILAVGYRG